MFRIFYTTQMSSNARQLQTRFAKMRSKSGRFSKIIAAVMTAALVMVMATATVVIAVVDTDTSQDWSYEIYNGDKLVPVKHSPMIYGSEYYVPLRETLNGFGITDITYADGVATVTVPEDEVLAPLPVGTENRYYRQFNIDVNYKYPAVIFGGEESMVLRGAPFIIDGTMYVSVECIEELMRYYASLENFSLNVIKPTEPEHYYEKGEEVVIGTAAEQDEYTKNNPQSIVKRIITDDEGKVIVVVPVENQAQEVTEAIYSNVPARGINGYYGLFEGAASIETPNGKKINLTELYLIYSRMEFPEEYYLGDTIAYIAITDFVTMPRSEFNEGMRSIITNTYDAHK